MNEIAVVRYEIIGHDVHVSDCVCSHVELHEMGRVRRSIHYVNTLTRFVVWYGYVVSTVKTIQ